VGQLFLSEILKKMVEVFTQDFSNFLQFYKKEWFRFSQLTPYKKVHIILQGEIYNFLL